MATGRSVRAGCQTSSLLHTLALAQNSNQPTGKAKLGHAPGIIKVACAVAAIILRSGLYMPESSYVVPNWNIFPPGPRSCQEERGPSQTTPTKGTPKQAGSRRPELLSNRLWLPYSLISSVGTLGCRVKMLLHRSSLSEMYAHKTFKDPGRH
jgi:hypothetical protein